MSRHPSRIRRLERQYRSGARAKANLSEQIPKDPVAFARSLNIEPDPWQRDLLNATEEHIILNCARQSGKSTIVAIRALHHALTNPGSLVLILSPTLRQSGELFKKITAFYRELGRRGGSDVNSATTLQLTNLSRIVSLPGSEPTIRGYSAPSLVLIDEAAQVSDELYYAVRPMFATSSGQLILLSTPRGKQGIFWHAWDQEPDWKKVNVTADQCPRISEEYLDQERRALPTAWFSQEYCCEFVQDEGCIFKEEWLQYFQIEDLPLVDMIIQSWDTAQTKSASSDYVVGQVWARNGADFYLLDQVRGKMDFDETVAAMKALTKKWSDSSSIVIEAQPLGAALASHLKKQIPGIIPIHVKGGKELRAMHCVPVWQSRNVYIPDTSVYSWVHDYVGELLNFPNAAHDDQVDATTLALNQLRGSLFPNIKAVAKPIEQKAVNRGHEYVIGWIPARLDDDYTVVVYDQDDNEVAAFFRGPSLSIEEQVKNIYDTSRVRNGAVVRVFAGFDEAFTYRAELKGTFVEKVKFTQTKLVAAYENLSQLIESRLISIPEYPELMAELSVFKSAFTYDEKPDYSLQIAQQSGIHALCLVTHDLDPTMGEYQPDIYYSFDPDRLDPSLWFPDDNSRQHYPF